MRGDPVEVNFSGEIRGASRDVVGTGVSSVVDEIGDALDALSAGGRR